MPDWKALVERHLAAHALEPAERAEVIVKLAVHLDEVFTELRGQGLTEEEAFRRTFS
jgi:hypothetical protein